MTTKAANRGPTAPQTSSASQDLPGVLAADLMAVPWWLAQAIHVSNTAWCHLWARFFLRSAFPGHPHERAYQLELPDPARRFVRT